MSLAGFRRFLQDTFGAQAEQSVPPPELVAAQQSAAALANQRAADDVIDIFAWEALVALQKYEEYLGEDDPATPAAVGGLLVRTWNEAGLDLAEWTAHPDRSDAQALLRAAVNSAVRYPDAGGTVQGAVSDLAGDVERRRFPGLTVGEAATEMERAYGQPFVNADPAQWLRNSLARVAAARLVRDTVGLEARAEPGPEAQRWARRILLDSELHVHDQQQAVGIAQQHQREVAGSWRGKVVKLAAAVAGYAGLDYAFTGDVNQWFSVGLVAIAVGSGLARSYRDDRRQAHQGVGSAQAQNRGDRSHLAAALDQFGEQYRPPSPGARGRPKGGIEQR